MNEVKNYHKLEEKIKMMTRQRKGTERFKIPNIDILQEMFPYFLKCKKNINT